MTDQLPPAAIVTTTSDNPVPVRLSSPLGQTAKARRRLYRGELSLAKGDLVSAERAGQRVLRWLNSSVPDRVDRTNRQDLLVPALELTARTRRQLADFKGAAGLHEQALSALTASSSHALRAVILIRLGETHRLLGRYSEAEKHHRSALALAEGLDPVDQRLLTAAHNGLGIVFKDTHRYDDALGSYEQALTVAVRELGPAAPELADIQHNLAGLHHSQGNFIEGEPHARHALDLRHPTLGSNSLAAAGDCAVLGALLLGQGRHPEAEAALEAALKIWTKRFGPNHYEVAVVEHNLAALYLARGEHRRATAAYQRVLRIKRAVLGPDNPEVLAMQRHLSNVTEEIHPGN